MVSVLKLGLLVMIMLGLSVLSQAITAPLVGTLVRFRAHYNPKGLQLDPESDVQPHTGPIISSPLKMFRRIYRIEGWPGLYKGLMPFVAVSSFLCSFIRHHFLDVSNNPHETYSALYSHFISGLVCSISGLFLCPPQSIITKRAITTPYKLPYFKAEYSHRILLTPTERQRPCFHLIPGVSIAQYMSLFYIVSLQWMRRLCFPELPDPVLLTNGKASLVEVTVVLAITLLRTLILVPLEVISIRLSIQRNHAVPGSNSISQEEDGDAEKATRYAGEDVISLRTDKEPYTGLIDCAKKIIDEEGWGALYCGWWLTALMMLSM